MRANNYEEKKKRLVNELHACRGHGIQLAKTTSNLFRDRTKSNSRKLDVRSLNQVLTVDTDELWAEVEGMTTYEDFVNATLPHGVMPTVVPELKSITLGGAVTGIGIESSSFKHGLVHEGILEMEVLLANGNVVVCTPTNQHKDLFFAFPNSYGTFGYVLKLKTRLIPIKDYVELKHVRYERADAFFDGLRQALGEDIDFLDGTVFEPNEMYLTIGRFTDEVPYTSDYTYENIYYQSIRRRDSDYLTILDYIWRWDTDWFWCSKNLLAQHSWVRALAGKSRLNSVTYTKIMRWNSRWKLSHRINRLLGFHSESVIQDVDIAIDKAPAFLDFFHKEVGIKPIWVCPIRIQDTSVRFGLYPLDGTNIYINFGFWDVKKGRENRPNGYYNRKIERKVTELGGLKSLYSDSYYPPEEFWQIYNKSAYDRVKAKYDPDARLKDIYQKCVLRQ
ncbi:MAG: FAD-dependent oxidoreductase [Acidiferrobacterales bacterium]